MKRRRSGFWASCPNMAAASRSKTKQQQQQQQRCLPYWPPSCRLAVSQIALLILFAATDPMLLSLSSSSVTSTTDMFAAPGAATGASPLLEGVADVVNGLE